MQSEDVVKLAMLIEHPQSTENKKLQIYFLKLPKKILNYGNRKLNADELF